jgi:hypothetical protein
MLELETDEKYMETYISYVTFKLQKHIIEKVGNRKQPGNKLKTFKDKKKMIQKGAVKKAIDEGKPSVNVQKLESDIMKVQADVDIARKFLRDYEQLQQIIQMERGERIAQEEFLNLAYQDGQPIELENIDRWKSNLISNIYGAIDKLKNTQLIEKELNELIDNFCNSDRGYNFNTDLLNEETMDIINTIIEKYEKEPFLRWNYNLKIKLRYNFAEDFKKTRNKIKITASLPSEIKPEQFANHYVRTGLIHHQK